MKLKKILCMAVVSVAVALTGIPQGATALVHAEETQIAGLDEILRQIYGSYQTGDWATIRALDDSASDYVALAGNSGSDRYVIDLDGNTKAMMYMSSDGGYWWYFGQMKNNLREGQGTTIVVGNGNSYEVFTGNYTADMPNGEGKHSTLDGEIRTDIVGNFHGLYLNGTYQVDVNGVGPDGVSYSSSLPLTYVDNHFKSVNENERGISLLRADANGDSIDYVFGINRSGMLFENRRHYDNGRELFTVGFMPGDTTYSYALSRSPIELNNGLVVFWGNTNAVATQSAPTELAVTPNVPAEPTEPAVTPNVPAPTPNTYVVERGDNLSKIAKKVYGDTKCWRIIYEANKNVIKSDYTIWANQVLVIPAR